MIFAVFDFFVFTLRKRKFKNKTFQIQKRQQFVYRIQIYWI